MKSKPNRWKTKAADGGRRRILQLVGFGVGSLVIPAVAGGRHRKAIRGPLASATVSFGAWPTDDPPLDRMTSSAMFPRNVHQQIPQVVSIAAGGTVNFVIAGFHQIAVYGPGTSPADIDTGSTTPVPGAPADFPGLLIDDPANRVYRGPVHFTMPLDRTEAIHFAEAGLHLVICTVLSHFTRDDMYGWVRVLP